MKIPTSDLRSAFELCDAVESETTFESSLFVRLTQDATELTLALAGTIWAEARASGSEGSGKWTAYVDRRILKAFLATARDEVQAISKDSKLMLRSGNKLELPHRADINGYQSWKPAKKYDVPDELKRIMAAGIEYLPDTAGAEHSAAINVRTDCVIATNTLCLMGVFGASFPENVLVPPEVAKFISKNGGKLGTDKNGVGAVTDHGTLYQTRSSHLDNYPLANVQKHLAAAVKWPTSAVVDADDLLDAVKTGTQFLLDKQELGLVQSVDKGLSLFIELAGGPGSQFRRVIPAAVKIPLPEIRWAVKKATPWLEFAVDVDKSAKIEIARAPGALVFRFDHQKKQYVFLSSDL